MAVTEKFMLVVFVDDVTNSKSIDIVPAKWIFYDDIQNHLVTPFISNCSKKSTTILNNLVQCQGEPLQSWALHRVSIRGSASSYTEAERKIQDLATKSFVFTTDSEEHAKAREFEITKKYKMKGKKYDQQDVSKLFEASAFHTNEETEKSVADVAKKRSENAEKTTGVKKKIISSKDSKYLKPSPSVRSPRKDKQKKMLPVDESDSESSRSGHSEYGACKQFESETNYEPDNDSDEDALVKEARKGYKPLEKSKERSHWTLDNPAENLVDVDKPRYGIIARTPWEEHSSEVTGGRSIERNDRNGPHSTTHHSFSTGTLDVDGSDDTRAVVLKCYRRLSAQIGQIQSQLADLKIRQTEIISVTSGLSSRTVDRIIGIDSTVEKYNLGEVPFKTLTDFKEFDEKLKSNKSIRNEITNGISVLVNPDMKYLTKSIRDIIQRLMTRDVFLNFTAVRQSGDKIIFKQDTTLYNCMRDAILSKICDTNITEKKIHDAIGSVINNAKDWDGHRQIRKKDNENRRNTGHGRGSRKD